jgi:hypothetical protein
VITIEREVTLAELDEALAHVYAMLKTDEAGNRMDWRKKQILETSLDDLLDARLNLTKTGNAVID